MSDTNYTVFNAMVDIIASPGKALDNIKDHTSWLWYPLLISIGLAALVFAYYYSWVDMDWLVEDRIRNLPPERQAEAADQMRAFSGRGMNMGVTIISIIVMSFIIYSIQAAYFHLANKLTTGSDIRYGQWFSFSVWTAFVNVFGSLAILVTIFTAGSNQLAEADLSPITFNALLVHAEPGDDWFTWASSLSLINIWMLVLMSIGFSRWTGSAMVKSAIIAVLPWALIFGIWAALI